MSDGQSQITWRPETNSENVTTLWFDSPGRSQNVLDPVAFDGLDQCLAEIEADSSIRGVLIRSAKPAGFCAGADLKTIQACTSAGDLSAYLRHGLAVLDRLARLRFRPPRSCTEFAWEAGWSWLWRAAAAPRLHRALPFKSVVPRCNWAWFRPGEPW